MSTSSLIVMDFFRTYAQPNQPEHFRVFGFDVVNDDALPYSQALKAVCKTWAGPQPKRPSQCPRCHVENVSFMPNLCYKVGIAGAWNLLCSSCHKVHIPSQQGLSNEGLDHIETVRARDHQEFLARKAKKAKEHTEARAKARAIAPKEEPGDEATSQRASSSDIEASVLDNAANLQKAIGPPGGHGDGTTNVERRDSVVRGRGGANYYMRGSRCNGYLDGAEENARTAELIFWAHDQEPRIDRVPVEFDQELFLCDIPYFQNMQGPCAFERFYFEDSLWYNFSWRTSPIHVGQEDNVVFVCAMGVRCHSFGWHLERYQHWHGLSLNPGRGIRATIDIPPPEYQWLVIWGEHGNLPEIHLFNLDLADSLDDKARLALPWAHLIANAPFLLIWHETESCWAAVGRGVTSGVIEAPIALVAHPDAENLVGSGEAITWLEEWRSGGGPRSRTASPPLGTKRTVSTPLADERSKLDLATPTEDNTRALIAIPPTTPLAGHPPFEASASNLRPSGFPTGERSHESPSPKPLPPFPPSQLLDEDMAVAKPDRASAMKRSAPASSDDEVVLVDGAWNAAGVPPHPESMLASTAVTDEVEEINVHLPSVRRQSHKKRHVFASIDACVLISKTTASNKALVASAPSTMSDDDIVLIEHPSATLMRQFSKKPRTSDPSDTIDHADIVDEHPPETSSGAALAYLNVRAPAKSCRTPLIPKEASDDEVEIVEDSSVILKRRLTMVNGREVIDLT